MDKNNMILNRFFVKNMFSNLINGYDNAVYITAVKRYLQDADSKKNLNIISEIYLKLKNDYRNEYFYKNTLLNKLLLGKHSLNTTTALTEVPINKSKADFVLINGKAVVYEIKTELDTFDRLEGQLNNYYKAFDNVCVITCESNYDRIRNILKDTNVGICILTDRNTISTRKKPISDYSKLSHNTIFKILRKKEFENILMSYYGKLPITKAVNYYSECYNLFQCIDIHVAYKYMIKEIKKRNRIEIDEYKLYVPYELKFLIYFAKFNRKDYLKLNKFLNKRFGG